MLSTQILPLSMSTRWFSGTREQSKISVATVASGPSGISSNDHRWPQRAGRSAPGSAFGCPGPASAPADAPAGLVLHDVIDHVILAQLAEIHLHRKDVPDAADRRAGHHAPHHPRAVEIAVPVRVCQTLEDVSRRGADPPRYRHGLVLVG